MLSGTSVDGPLLLMQGVDTQTLTHTTLNADWLYSNTGTALTLNGTAYRVAYGKIAAGDGIVQQFNLVGREEANRCVFSGTFTHK